MKLSYLAPALLLAFGNTPAAADCTWEWLCNGEGACKHMPICDSVYEIPPARPDSQPPAMPPLSMRPHRIAGAGHRRVEHAHVRAHHAQGQDRPLVLARGLLLQRSVEGQGPELAVLEHRALRRQVMKWGQVARNGFAPCPISLGFDFYFKRRGVNSSSIASLK